MFRGKESSNRIELSRLVQDLLNFGVLGSLRLWGWGVGGGWGVPHTHVHMHAHARTHTHAHARMVNMIISCKWLPPLGESLGIPYDVIRVRACECMCMCVWDFDVTKGWAMDRPIWPCLVFLFRLVIVPMPCHSGFFFLEFWAVIFKMA